MQNAITFRKKHSALQFAQIFNVNTVNIPQKIALVRKSAENLLTKVAHRGIISNKKSVDREEVDQRARTENCRVVQDRSGVG